MRCNQLARLICCLLTSASLASASLPLMDGGWMNEWMDGRVEPCQAVCTTWTASKETTEEKESLNVPMSTVPNVERRG
ncbi:hypothetical protein F5B17DRAFT_400259, partial [Nemania serpens]